MIETGQLLQDRYRIDRQIGQGGMGAVYVATDERFGSTVAIKETLCMDDNYRKAIEREARLLNSLKHVALPRDPNKIVVDGETIYMGDTKITDDRIETPDTIIDDNGVTPKVPSPPRVRNPRMIPPPDLSHLTPEQRRRVLRAMRRNGVIIVRPTPTP